MPRGAAVIPYDGKRGRVWRVKYADATGRQVMETVGAEPAVTRKDAERALCDRLVKVEQKGYRKPRPVTFGDWSATWLEQGQRRRGWKAKTVRTHAHRLAHLADYFGRARLDSIQPSDVTGYIQHALGDR